MYQSTAGPGTAITLCAAQSLAEPQFPLCRDRSGRGGPHQSLSCHALRPAAWPGVSTRLCARQQAPGGWNWGLGRWASPSRLHTGPACAPGMHTEQWAWQGRTLGKKTPPREEKEEPAIAFVITDSQTPGAISSSSRKNQICICLITCGILSQPCTWDSGDRQG